MNKNQVLVLNQFMQPQGGACILPIDTVEKVWNFEEKKEPLYAEICFGELVRYKRYMIYLAKAGSILETGITIGTEDRKEIGYKIQIKKKSLVLIRPGLWHQWSKT